MLSDGTVILVLGLNFAAVVPLVFSIATTIAPLCAKSTCDSSRIIKFVLQVALVLVMLTINNVVLLERPMFIGTQMLVDSTPLPAHMNDETMAALKIIQTRLHTEDAPFRVHSCPLPAVPLAFQRIKTKGLFHNNMTAFQPLAKLVSHEEIEDHASIFFSVSPSDTCEPFTLTLRDMVDIRYWAFPGVFFNDDQVAVQRILEKMQQLGPQLEPQLRKCLIEQSYIRARFHTTGVPRLAQSAIYHLLDTVDSVFRVLMSTHGPVSYRVTENGEYAVRFPTQNRENGCVEASASYGMESLCRHLVARNRHAFGRAFYDELSDGLHTKRGNWGELFESISKKVSRKTFYVLEHWVCIYTPSEYARTMLS